MVKLTCAFMQKGSRINQLYANNASINSTGALAFFSLGWQIPPGWGHLSYQMPRGGDEGRGQMPRPRDGTSPINTAAVFIHCTIMPLSELNV